MPIQSLMRPRSVAILGDSDRPSIGRAIMDSLSTLGFPGEVYPINPKYGELLGRTCYPSIAELPAAPDVVAFCVSSARVLAGIEQCAEHKAGAAVIYDAGFGQQMEEMFQRDLQNSKEYTLADFKKRSFWERATEWVAMPFRSQL